MEKIYGENKDCLYIVDNEIEICESLEDMLSGLTLASSKEKTIIKKSDTYNLFLGNKYDYKCYKFSPTEEVKLHSPLSDVFKLPWEGLDIIGVNYPDKLNLFSIDSIYLDKFPTLFKRKDEPGIFYTNLELVGFRTLKLRSLCEFLSSKIETITIINSGGLHIQPIHSNLGSIDVNCNEDCSIKVVLKKSDEWKNSRITII